MSMTSWTGWRRCSWAAACVLAMSIARSTAAEAPLEPIVVGSPARIEVFPSKVVLDTAGRSMAVDHQVDVVPYGFAHGAHAGFGVAHRRETFERRGRRNGHRLDGRKSFFDASQRELGKPVRVGWVDRVEVLQATSAKMAIGANEIAHRPAP